MKKRIYCFQIIFAIATLIIACSIPNTVKAIEQKGTLTIFKKDTTQDHNPIGDVGFTIYKVADDFTNVAVDVSTLTAIGTEQKTQTTGDDRGKTTFEDLEIGRYLVVESSRPAEITESITPFLVDIPQYEIADDVVTANYDVVVEPKNTIGFASFKIVTHDLTRGSDDATNIRENVTYYLQYKDGENWKDISQLSNPNTTPTYIKSNSYGSNVILKSDATGTIEVFNLPVGEYRFILKDISNDKRYIYDYTPYNISVKNIDGTIVATEDGITPDDTIDAYITAILFDKSSPKNHQSIEYGEEIQYTITADFSYISDELLDKGIIDGIEDYSKLKIDASSLVVKCGDNTLVKDIDYYIEIKNDYHNFNISFSQTGISAIKQDKIVTIEYLTKFEIQEWSWNSYGEGSVYNHSQLNYYDIYPTNLDDRTDHPKNPSYNDANRDGLSDLSKWVYRDTDAIAYYQYFLKVNTDGEKLEGGKFQIATSNETDEDGNPLPENILTAWQINVGETNIFETSEDGLIGIFGLKEGIYYLFEIEPPKYTDGEEEKEYQKLNAPIAFLVNETNKGNRMNNGTETNAVIANCSIELGEVTLTKTTLSGVTSEQIVSNGITLNQLATGETIPNSKIIAIANCKPLNLPLTGAMSSIGLVGLGSILLAYGINIYSKNKDKK